MNGSPLQYGRLFGELRVPEGADEARSVCSPAAYFVELLGLLEGTFDGPALLERRPDLRQIVLDSGNTFTETPYLDIVNEVLERLVGTGAYETLRTSTHPMGLPFSLDGVRLREALDEAQVTPEELYRLFTAQLDHDVAARECLGLTAEAVGVIAAAAADDAAVGGLYGLAAGEKLDVLRDTGRFAAATAISDEELRELVALPGQTAVAAVGMTGDETAFTGDLSAAWLDRAVRLVRYARGCGFTLIEADLVLTTFRGGLLDLAALRTAAGVVRLGQLFGQSVSDVCGLVTDWTPDPGVIVKVCSGDILTAANRDYRFRLAALIGLAEQDIEEIVRRYRERYAGREPSPFDRGTVGLPEISTLRRCGLLAGALGLGVGELFDVLVALEGDPALQRYSTFQVIGVPQAPTRDLHKVLEGGAGDEALWLAQTLFAVAAWMRAAGFDGAELVEILGGRPDLGDLAPKALFDRLQRDLDQVAFEPDALKSDRFGDRAAQVIHDVLTAYDKGVVAAVGSRLLDLDPEVADAAAYHGVTNLAVVYSTDFQGLGLGDRYATKIFQNLVRRGRLRADGVLTSAPDDDLVVSSDFDDLREMLFKSIGANINGTAAYYPSDLAVYDGLSDELRGELYDNLIFNGWLQENGDITEPDFFLEADNLEHFEVTVDLSAAVEPVTELIEERLAAFHDEPLTFDPQILAGLRLTDAQTTRLVQSLQFNGYLDADRTFIDQNELEELTVEEFALAAEFTKLRPGILEALQHRIAEHRAELTTFTVADFADLADELASERVFDLLDNDILDHGLIAREQDFASPDGTLDLGPGFTAEDGAQVHTRLAGILADQARYRVSRGALSDLGLTDSERDEALAYLVGAGELSDRHCVTSARLAYFADADNSLDYALPGMEDYAREIFLLLHTAAAELNAAVIEVTTTLASLATKQDQTLYATFADVLGISADAAQALCQAVIGSPRAARLMVAARALDEPRLPDDPRLPLALRRIRRFALLIAKLSLDPDEIRAVFADQDLAGKYPEPLTLPPGVDRIDALLDSQDGMIYLFTGAGYWTYSRTTYAPISTARKPLTELSPDLAALVAVNAAFARPDGTEWLIGHDAQGAIGTFVRQPGGKRWAPKPQIWGKIKNNFTDPAHIDSAFTDLDGRSYLFAGDQYVRYSGGYDTVDEGYPRPVTEWWECEGLHAAPGDAVDACFQDLDGTVNLFCGTRWSTPGTEAPASDVWGVVRPTDTISAAYTTNSAVEFLAGTDVLRYSDSIENAGVLADEGVPRRLPVALPQLPPQFDSGVDAAFTDPTGVLHVFKDGQTAALDGGTAQVVRTADRWGVLAPPLRDGQVDAAFAGLDGRTYLFSSTTYLRYSTADYTMVDSGFPRSIATDWGGLTQVEAAFVMGGATYLFGVGGLLFDVPPQFQADLDAGQATPELHNLLLQYGLTLTAVSGAAPQWSLGTAEGITLTVRLEGLVLKAYGDGSRFYVRYSTHDYHTPDPGFPKPLSDNWWNMPDDMRLGPINAVFTGADGRTYLFAGDRYVRFDARHRWWSEPMLIAGTWDSIPFGTVESGFVGTDGRTYLFSGTSFVRYSTDDYTEVDDGYPAQISSLWGRVSNNLARTGHVDAAFVLDVTETVDGAPVQHTYTYLFSGDQYVRYSGAYDVIDPGYPREVGTLATEPGLAALPVRLDGVDAAFSDRRTAYLLRHGQIYAASTVPYRRYTDLPAVSCAYIEDGSVVAEVNEGEDSGWVHLSALEGRAVTATPFRPRTLRAVPARYRSGLDSVLTGADGNTYLFQGPSCYNVGLAADYPAEQEWGRPRSAIYETGAVDAAFVGLDGKTYLFSDDQFVVYSDASGLTDVDPQPIADHWAGLTSVVLAYVQGDQTYLFEAPAEDGTVRLAVYTGPAYTTPDEVATRLDHFGAPDGFPFPDAVLVKDTTLILLAGEACVSYDERTKNWSKERPIERLYPGFGHGLDHPDTLRSAFEGADGATYFFFGQTYAAFDPAADTVGALAPVRDRWGLTRNPFLTPASTIDAAFVWRGQYTYLFSGDRYVRYTGAGYRYIDPGYPKPIAVELRKEPPFTQLLDTFEDDLLQNGQIRPFDAVLGNDRTVHLMVGGVCHTISPARSAVLSTQRLGQTRNTLASTGKVDAALVADQRLYLFSGDQYYRYSTADRSYVDDGYPRALADLAAEQGLPPLPPEFQDGLDAVLRGPDGVTRLFKGRSYLAGGSVQPIAGRWGVVHNAFDSGGVDTAFTGPSGELYVFRAGQYVRYAADSLMLLADPGYPRAVEHDWGELPPEFEAGPDGAFVLDGRTYLLKGDQFVRYSSGFHTVDRTFPQTFAYRWSGTADYRLTDVHTIKRFAELCRAHPDGLASFLLDGAPDPYTFLAQMFGWQLDDVRWARRNMALLHPSTSEEQLFEIEFLLGLTGLFGTAGKLGAGPAEIYSTVWSQAYGPVVDLDAAATALMAMLARRGDWTTVSATLHNKLNVAKRDALLAYLIPPQGTSRDLYEQYLIDVDMGPEGTTSRVREAIAATQLYLQRWLLGLEQAAVPAGVDPEQVRTRLRTWWTWMRNYRTWEANRKVFLFPENYLRPELRVNKTPAFKSLEDDLLQGEITADAVDAAYKRYLDEYTEVSRLAIAGGYVYTADAALPGVRELVLFGRTRTEPRRYYVRTAEFRDGAHLSATWEPWQKVDAQITADRVDPVHAFGRIFVFWPVIEPVPQADQATTTITTTSGSGGSQHVAAPPPHYHVKIYYSFRNLAGEWVSAQLLATDDDQNGPITGVRLYVQASRTVPGVSDHDSIVVQCSYQVGTTAVTSAFTLTPELYGLRATGTVPPPKPANLSRIFLEPATTPITPDEVVRFNMPADSQDGPWCSIDHKGGSFLCRPVAGPAEPAPLSTFAGNTDRLPTTWNRVDAGFRLPDDTLYFFDAAGGVYITAPPGKLTYQQNRQSTAGRFGIVGTNMLRTGVVDAGLARGGQVLLFSGDEYYRYSPFGTLEPGYPKKLETNTEGLPQWTKVDMAFVEPTGIEVFYSKQHGAFVVSGALTMLRPESERQLPQRPDAGPVLNLGQTVVTFDNAKGTYTLSGPGQAETPRSTRDLGKVPTELTRTGVVTAAYVESGLLYLAAEHEFVRYTLGADSSIPEYVDAGYPKALAAPVNGVFPRDDVYYVFNRAGYATLAAGQELDSPLTFTPYQDNWRALPTGFPAGFHGVLCTDKALFFFLGTEYAAYPLNESVLRPYEIDALPHEIVRLTSSTAYELNRRLLTGGVSALLDPGTQELAELPAFSTTVSDATTVQVRKAAVASIPAASHLDFDGSNGLYNWEIFFHAPLLIGHALNGAQRFEDARTWYDYVFDPTLPADYWRFLPFLGDDVTAISAGCLEDLAILGDSALTAALTPILTALDAMAPAFRNARDLTPDELTELDGYAAGGLDAVRSVLGGLTQDDPVVQRLGEQLALIAQLRRQYDLMGDRDALLEAYLDDPFDPHAIAALRPVAYRRAVVMAYLDNLIDWGDLLFRQYTNESVDEARMLYIYAYDLLGRRPHTIGLEALPPAAPYELTPGTGPGESADHLTGDGTMVEKAGAVHGGVANPYFYVPANDTLLDYWTRVEDRLTKIRASLDIMGISRPLPLFDPPADVMALVRGAAAGLSAEQVMAAAAAPLSPYRFDFVQQRARELADRLQQLGSQLLDIIDRRDNERLNLLRNQQDAELLALTRQIKETQVKISEEELAGLQASQDGAQGRVTYYQKLISDGLSPLQEGQLAMLALATAAQFTSGGLKIAAAIATGAPQTHIGPFIMGTSIGGDEIGGALTTAADVTGLFGQGFAQIGDILGVRSDQQRTAQDWDLQLGIAKADLEQLGHQVASADLQVAVAKRDLEIHLRQIAQTDAVTDFLAGKFANVDLYGWMSGRLSGLYFQVYQLAYEMAQAAERAYEAERGVAAGIIRPGYWDSLRKGLLAGEQLGFDLDRLGHTYAATDTRRLEITKQVSLLRLDPLALLTLKNTGTCEFAFTETLFDRDFPGHYLRQVKSISVTFSTADGPVNVNAVLTQLDGRTVLQPDPKAVRFLLDPKGAPPGSLRADLRAGQQVALSETEEGRSDSGVFDLRFDDSRYLPFEGTGAVARWRLAARHLPPALLDVTIILKYTAVDGGETFGTAVRGMIKPYPTAAAIDVTQAFADQWHGFQSGGDLTLPISADLLPGISGRKVTGVAALFGTDTTQLQLGAFTLSNGQIVSTPGLTAGGHDWTLAAHGDPSTMSGLTLVVLYQAVP